MFDEDCVYIRSASPGHYYYTLLLYLVVTSHELGTYLK